LLTEISVVNIILITRFFREALEMRVIDFLDKSGVKYEVTEHKPAFTAQHVAAVEHEPGKYVAKPVVVKADEKIVMCVLPACYKIDLKALKKQMKAKKVSLLTEEEMGQLFGDCELGAEPPFGNLYDLPTVIDKTIEDDDHILFQAGSHEKAIRMAMADYMKLVAPDVMEFSYHMTS
jgi:Ala-tRNA(Pro) deacylase